MMKGLIIIPSYQEENMSNLTSAASGGDQASASNSFPAVKKKRNLPGNPDPEAEVVALSPKSLMATNRFVCEVCGKGFQRDQNLQLHRRGHNLPWKLKQRSGGREQARRKVYVCPEASCVHNDAARALGDLTGIKKHFSRKHGEKKWKCDKCSKKYAVQSDWKAHSKICGTREYRCGCGTLFSRRDSFITHRAFCDALAEESRRAITGSPAASRYHPLPFSQPPMSAASTASDPLPFASPMARFNIRPYIIPPWLACHQQPQLTQDYSYDVDQNPCIAAAAPPAPAHMSATALLQKAAQMGATTSKPPHHGQMANSTLHSSLHRGIDGSAFGGMLKREGSGNGGGDDGMTRDFLGLQRPFSHRDILMNIATSPSRPSGKPNKTWDSNNPLLLG